MTCSKWDHGKSSFEEVQFDLQEPEDLQVMIVRKCIPEVIPGHNRFFTQRASTTFKPSVSGLVLDRLI